MYIRILVAAKRRASIIAQLKSVQVVMNHLVSRFISQLHLFAFVNYVLSESFFLKGVRELAP